MSATVMNLQSIDLTFAEPNFAMPAWMRTSRQFYIDELMAKGLPSKKQEAFRYTDVSNITKHLTSVHVAEDSLATASVVEKITTESIRLVFINNVFHPQLSDLHLLPKGVIACCFKDALPHHEALLQEVWPNHFDVLKQPFACLNVASFKDGFFLYIPPAVILTVPLHFLHYTTSSNSTHAVNLLMIADNSQVDIFEEFVDEKHLTALHNQLTSILLQKNAVLNHIVLNNGHENALHWLTTTVIEKENAHASFVTCTRGSSFMRHDLTCHLAEPFASCATSAYYHAAQNQYVDNHIDILHLAPHTTSDMLFKGTLTDRAKAVFNGRLFVKQNAQKIVAFQANHHLLFSDQAESYSKPELEIYADDVKCKHGATTAAFDQEAIFYLRSRGLSETTAKALLLDAFFASILDRISLPPLFLRYIEQSVNGMANDV